LTSTLAALAASLFVMPALAVTPGSTSMKKYRQWNHEQAFLD